MSTTIVLPFQIGDVLWRPDSLPRDVTVVCPVCAGHRAIIVTLGDGEQVRVPCESCGIGFESPRGFLQQYEHSAMAHRFEIAALVAYDESDTSPRYRVQSTTGEKADLSELYETEADALAESERRIAAFREEQWGRRKSLRAHAAKQTGWTVRYHREQIKELERKLEWHRSKVTPPVAPTGNEK